jgi:hypothetical protein
MPAHDVFHAAVKKGLTREGWIITDDPLSRSSRCLSRKRQSSGTKLT